MHRFISRFGWALGAFALITLSTLLPAQETPAEAQARAEPAAEALPAPAAEEPYKPDATPEAPSTPMPSLEQRVAALEAYFANTDPSAALRDKDGNIPSGLTTVAGSNPGPGHNAWVMMSTALSLFMTVPGLALFYAGRVRRKNVLSVCAQCLGCAIVVTLLWWAFGYSLVFGSTFQSPVLGGAEYLFLPGGTEPTTSVGMAPNPQYSFWVSQNVFAMSQMMPAILAAALITGAVAERMKFSSLLIFVSLWTVVVYAPLAHMVLGGTGAMNGTGNANAGFPALDFAGGMAVHMAAGWSALVLCRLVGRRTEEPNESLEPRHTALSLAGTGLLFAGWLGLNGGAAMAADGIAANAIANTALAAAFGGFVWGLLEWMLRGRASVPGLCAGLVAGLVAGSPACGFVQSGGALIIGMAGAAVAYVLCTWGKAWLGQDDALDVFGLHAGAGTIGVILTGLLANGNVNPNIAVTQPANPATSNGLVQAVAGHTQIGHQLGAALLTIGLAVSATAGIALLLKKTYVGLRATEEAEQQGLGLSEHGEEGDLA